MLLVMLETFRRSAPRLYCPRTSRFHDQIAPGLQNSGTRLLQDSRTRLLISDSRTPELDSSPNTPGFRDQIALGLQDSTTRFLQDSKTPGLDCSRTPRLDCSSQTPGLQDQIAHLILQDSGTRLLQDSRTDLLNVQTFTPTGFYDNKIHAKKCVNFVKILIATK